MRTKMNLLASLICPALMACSVSAYAVQAQIAGVNDHTIFIDSGNVYGFGLSTWGTLKTGQIVPGSAATEYLVPTFTGVGNAKSVAVGYWRSAALLTDGTVKLWGMSTAGSVPTTTYTIPSAGTVTDIALSQTKLYYVIAGEVYEWDLAGVPTKVSTTTMGTASAVAAGPSYIVILYSDGSVGTYGSNTYGQLGNGTTLPSTVVAKVVGISGATNIAVAGSTVLVTLNSGTVLGFGRNQYGQLGTGEQTNKLTPVVVTALAGAKRIYGGDGYVAAISGTDTLRVAGWHNYISGALYNLNTTFVDIPGAVGVKDAGGGTNTHTVSFGIAGELQGWGGGSVPVGNGTHTEFHTLTPVTYTTLPSSLLLPVVIAPTPVVVAEETKPLCKFTKASSPWDKVTDVDAYNCGTKVYKYTTDCVKAHSKDKGLNVVALCTAISDDGDKINCNNGWGNGTQCAPGKSADKNNAANATNSKVTEKSLITKVLEKITGKK